MMDFEVRHAGPESVYEVLHSLKHAGYNVLVDLTAVDYSAHPEGRKGRFEMVYRLASIDSATGLETKPRCEIHCPVGEEPVLRSVLCLWPVADWLEREVWDMFGIKFQGHPNLKRLLMYEEFQGHALKKDYPYNKRQPLIGPKN